MAIDFSEVLAEVKKGNAEQATRDADALKKQKIADDKALKSYKDGQKKFEDKFVSNQEKLIDDQNKAQEAYAKAIKNVDMRTKEGKQLKEQHEQTIAQLNQDFKTNQASLEEDQALAQEQEVQRLEDIKYREEERKKKDEQEQTAAGQLKLREEELDLIKKDIEERGVSAENIEEYTKMQAELAKDTFQLAYQQSSKSAQKEMLKEQFKKDRKQLTVLQQIQGGIGVLGDSLKERLVKGGSGFLDFLKKGALVGLLLLLPKIINSQAVKDIITFVQDKVIPFFGKLKDFLFNLLGEKGVLVLGLIAAAALFAPATTFTALKLAIMGVTKGLTPILGAFTFLKGALISIAATMGMGVGAAAGTIVGIAAAIVSVVYGLFKGIQAFRDKFKETGNIFESARVAFATFLGEALGLIPNLLLDLTGYIAGLFGFDKFKEKIQAIDVGKILTDSFLDLFDKVSFFIRELYLKIKPVLDKVGNFLQPAVDVIKSIANFIMKLLQPFKIVIDKAKAIFKKIGGAIGGLFTTTDEERQEAIEEQQRNIEMMREQDAKLGNNANKFAIQRAEERIAKLQSEMGPELDTNVETAKLEELPQRETVKPVASAPVMAPAYATAPTNIVAPDQRMTTNSSTTIVQQEVITPTYGGYRMVTSEGDF